MNSVCLLAAVLIPVIGGALLLCLPVKGRRGFEILTESIVLITSFLVIAMIIRRPSEAFILVQFTGDMTIAFRMDGLSMVFGGMISVLWPLAMLYAFEYMKHEHNARGDFHERSFFAFYTATFGVTLGIALADNYLTMYCFYEMLTLITVPLVMYTLSREAILATRKYMYYSLGGAGFAFLGMIFTVVYGDNMFRYGGSLDMGLIGGRENLLLLVYVLSFFGFGVKAAVCPLNSWLPQAGVAPTPVTALLHAVAVVKSGAFAILRLTYYCFGIAFLKGTWAQYAVMAAAMVTIIYGCSRAVKETHIKRRLAYSTISNLSYILFGATIMTPLGLTAALSHMLFHGIMKICSFFCAGAVICQTGKTYVHQLDGLGRRMPRVFGIFTLSALALMGVPGLCGFISKWNLASAAIESRQPLAYFGVAALLISAILTAIYMLTVVVRAFFPLKGFDGNTIAGITDPSWYMLVPLFVFSVMIIYFGLGSIPLMDLLTDIGAGLF